ncbi:MAG: hypothetical protein MR283_01940 [Erysipelotrichaceae bacterium]|nr:hypothetical protein [Erysipelotrichaceae bacterium]MDY6035271.1 hypothetical protein [Bulleidia sp.]
MDNRIVLFGILTLIGIILYVIWVFFAQRQVMYMSLLLYRQGDADKYLEELESPSSHFFFNKKLRTLMAIDANLVKGDAKQLNLLFEKANAYKLKSTDRILVQQKELLFRITRDENEQAQAVYANIHSTYENLTEKQKTKYKEILTEIEYPYAIHVKKDGKYASELMEKAKVISEAVPAGICYIRAAQSYYLRKDFDRTQHALEKAVNKLKETSYYAPMQDILKSREYKQLLSYRV